MADHSSTDTADAIKKGWSVKGNPDIWELVAKAEFRNELGEVTDYHSTKVLSLANGGCIIQSDSRVDGQFVRAQTYAPAPVGYGSEEKDVV